jgi:nucleoside-diphosphate-sugar epimerase
MRLLVLGGTKFLGRGIVDAALAGGHSVTLFNRGQTNPSLYPEVESLRGDRDGDLSAVAGREWDAGIDPSGYLPRLVRASAELLRGAVGHYVFVSSISVYAFPFPTGIDESAPLNPAIADADAVDGETYGGLKVGCENVVREVFEGAFTNVRSGLIVGPHDPTGRFTYWPVRVARGGEVLAPGDPERVVQVVDARDLGAWLVHVAEQRIVGDFNATGEPRLTMGELLETCRAVSGSDAELVWMSDEFLLGEGVGPWMELPLWLEPAEVGFLQAEVSRAVAAGLRFRPLEETVADTLAWAREDGAAQPLASGMAIGEAGMKAEREAELLALWRAR